MMQWKVYHIIDMLFSFICVILDKGNVYTANGELAKVSRRLSEVVEIYWNVEVV